MDTIQYRNQKKTTYNKRFPFILYVICVYLQRSFFPCQIVYLSGLLYIFTDFWDLNEFY